LSILFFAGCGIDFFCCMKTLSALLVAILFTFSAHSQISGKLVSAGGEAVGFATVSILKTRIAPPSAPFCLMKTEALF
jgi:hypothetical protein